MKKIISVILVFIFASCLCSCGKNNDNTDKLKIVTTLFPQYDFAKRIAGDKAEVTLLLSPGTESHDYDPTPSDVLKITSADVFIYTGAEMEPWAVTLLKNIPDTVKVTDCSEGIELSAFDEDEPDPHIWTSPMNAVKIVNSICGDISEADKENAEIYKKNAEEYVSELLELDEDIRKAVSEGKRKEIVFGSRFALKYFASEYGLDYIAAIDSCANEDEPSPERMLEIINKVKNDSIPVVYYEELSEPKIARKISEATGCEIRLFHSCHNVSKEDFESGVTYIDLMRNNLEVLKEGLG